MLVIKNTAWSRSRNGIPLVFIFSYSKWIDLRTVWKVSEYEVFLVRIFPYFDQKKLHIYTFFTQWRAVFESSTQMQESKAYLELCQTSMKEFLCESS